MAKSGRRSRSAQVNGGGGGGGAAGGVSVSGCAPTGRFRARAFRLWLWRALPVILILMMLVLILGSYLCSYPGITDSPKHSADLLKDKVNVDCENFRFARQDYTLDQINMHAYPHTHSVSPAGMF